MSSTALELFGYLGSLLVLVSMLMSSVVRLRVINMIGSAIFATYAILIRSYPTAFLNACLVGVNLYHLIRIHRSLNRNYLVQPLGAGEGFTAWFVDRYRDDIRRFFPAFDPAQAKELRGYAVFHENICAGLLLGTLEADTFEIALDYAVRNFRDHSVGNYLYDELAAAGVARLRCVSDASEHVRYMEKQGFVRCEDGSYVKAMPHKLPSAGKAE